MPISISTMNFFVPSGYQTQQRTRTTKKCVRAYANMLVETVSDVIVSALWGPSDWKKTAQFKRNWLNAIQYCFIFGCVSVCSMECHRKERTNRQRKRTTNKKNCFSHIFYIDRRWFGSLENYVRLHSISNYMISPYMGSKTTAKKFAIFYHAKRDFGCDSTDQQHAPFSCSIILQKFHAINRTTDTNRPRLSRAVYHICCSL